MNFNEIKKCNDEHKIYIGTDWGLNSDLSRYCYNDWKSTVDAYDKYCLGLLEKKKPVIEKVIFNNPATIVFWSDNTKTVAKCDKERFDAEKGLAMAIAKKFLGTNKSNSNYYDVFKKWIPKEESTSNDKSTECTLTINIDDSLVNLNPLGSTGESNGRTKIYFGGLI